VVIVADRDDAGRAHADEVAADLDDKASTVMIVEPAEGKDLSDHLAAGLGLDHLVILPPAQHRNAATPQVK
jgi:putative DNA primase/helicase